MSNITKVDNFLNDIEFEHDFGQEPIFIGRFTKDKAVIYVFSIVFGFVGWSIAQFPLALIVALIAWNDSISVDSDGKPRAEKKKVPPVVDTEAEPIYDEDYYQEPQVDEVEVQEHYRKSRTSPKEPPRAEKTAPKRESTRQAPQPRPEPVEEPEGQGWTWGERDEEPEEEVRPKRPDRVRQEAPRDSGIPQLPQVTNRAKRELIDRLKEECPALLKLIKSHPIRAVGMQRTGKSTLVKKLALLRMILLDGHSVVASTPHYEPANPYPNVFKVVGITSDGKRDYPSIRREWNALADRVEACKINSITTVWDEFGLQDKVMDEEEIKSVLTSCLRETMKFGEYPVFIVHGETAAFLPGSRGLVTVFLNGTVRVETIGELIEGEDGLETIRPTGKFNITWLDGSRDSGQIPEWLTEQYLLEMLGNPKKQETKYTSKWVDDRHKQRLVEEQEIERKKAQAEQKELEQLREQRNSHQGEGFTISSGLKEPLKTLLQKTKEHGDWMTVAEVQRRDWKNVKGLGVDKIHQHLGLLADMGLGEIDEEGKSHSAVRFKAL